MKINKFLFTSLILSTLLLCSNCGFTPIYSDKPAEFIIAEFQFDKKNSLEKRFVEIITMGKSPNESEVRELFASINIKKNKQDASKSETGETSSFKIEILLDVKIRFLDSNNFFIAEIYKESLNFNKQDQISDTLNIENEIIENILRKLSNDLTTRINQMMALKND